MFKIQIPMHPNVLQYLQVDGVYPVLYEGPRITSSKKKYHVLRTTYYDFLVIRNTLYVVPLIQ